MSGININLNQLEHWAIHQALGAERGDVVLKIVDQYGPYLAKLVPAISVLQLGNVDLGKWMIHQVLGTQKGGEFYEMLTPLEEHLPELLLAVSRLIPEHPQEPITPGPTITTSPTTLPDDSSVVVITPPEPSKDPNLYPIPGMEVEPEEEKPTPEEDQPFGFNDPLVHNVRPDDATRS